MQTSYTPSLVDDTSTVGLMSTRLRKNVAKVLIGTMLLLDLPILPAAIPSAMAAPADNWVPIQVKPDPMMQNLNIPANAATQGMWSPVYDWPLNGLHNMILPDGKVLTFGSALQANGWDQNGRYFDVWDPSLGFGHASHKSIYQAEQLDSFCTTAAYLNDGRLLITGGNSNARTNIGAGPGYGNGSTIYNPQTNTRTPAQAETALPRWYSTMITLPDGRKLIMGGMKPYTEGMADDVNGALARGDASMTPEVFENGKWRSLLGANSRDAFGPDFLRTSFPHAFVAPNGQVFGISAEKMWFLDPNAKNGNGAVTAVNFKRGYNAQNPVNVGALSNAVMYDIGKIIQLGGNGGQNGDELPASNMATIFDINNGMPNPIDVPKMFYARRMSNSIVLANGQVVVTGGTTVGNSYNPGQPAVFAAEIWDPRTNQWTLGANAAKIRVYHSITSLLTNGAILSTGGGNPGPVLNLNAEVYYPPYLFKQVGGASQLAARPAIKAISGLSYNNNDLIQMDMADGGQITGLSLIGLSNGTHAHNNGQRRIPLGFNQNGNRLSATIPNANLTPPGYYQVVALDAAGAPSYGVIIAIGQNVTPPPAPNPYVPPEVGNVDMPLMNADGVATYNLPAKAGYTYEWSFGDGTPNSPISNNPYVQHYFAKPGAYSVMVTMRDAQGIATKKTWVQAVATTKMGNNATNSSPIISEFELLTPNRADFCAPEGGYCAIPAGRTATVWYGVNDRWASKANVTGGIACNNATFGDHIAVVKSCRYQITDGLANRIFSVNPDSDTVSAIDSASNNVVATINVGSSPRTLAMAPDGRIWVTNKNSGTISIINQNNLTIAQTITLPRGSQPHGIAFGPAGGSAYVALEATGQLLKLDPNTGAQQGAVNVGINARHVAVTADGARVLVSRFITPPLPGEGTQNVDTTTQGGEVVVVNAGNMTFNKTVMLRHSDKTDTETQGAGIPNYLGAAAISPDGTTAWVPSKQDNIKRGTARSELSLNFQNTVRAISSRIDLGTQNEDYARRIDHDNSSLGSAVAYHPSGVYAFVALETSRQVAVINAIDGKELFRIDLGRAPQGIALSPDGNTMYVHEFMERGVTVFDLTPLTQRGQLAINGLKYIYTGYNEKLPPDVLLGKQFFYDAKDTRLAKDSYMSCASCHNDGGHDGRVWDFTDLGEGLRNTISLKGRAANGHGFMHWSANFDELQDFEGQIRNLAGGTGLMADQLLQVGTRGEPLGDKKAGLSPELDQLAAYVGSLNNFALNPNRNGDGSLTPAAAAGRNVFSNNCASCHAGARFTASADGGALKNIGTTNLLSGKRLTANLPGIDIPTLRDVWATAPYLHNGSAPTIAAAIQAHKNITLNATDLNNVAAYVQQIGGEEVNPPNNAVNPPPNVRLTAPAVNRIFRVGSTVTISAKAADNGNKITRVEFYNGGRLIGTDKTAPYSINWAKPPIGQYILSARAYSSDGGIGISSAVSITVDDVGPAAAYGARKSTNIAAGLWKFNEGYNNVVGDASNNNRPLTLINSAWAGGVTGLGAQFFGNSYGYTNEPVVNTASNFTVSAWVKLDNLNGWQTFANQDGNVVSGFWLQYSQGLGNKFVFNMHNTDALPSNSFKAVSTTSPVVGQWYHIVGVRDKDAGTMKIYVNGKLEGTTAYEGGWESKGSFNVGRGKYNAPNDWVMGAIDEVGAYGYALSGGDVANLYADSALAGAWRMNEGVNNVTGDASGNNKPLTFTNGTAWALGISGLGVQFNGGAGSTVGSVVNTAGTFTVSAWVKLDNLNGWQTFASQDGNAISGFWLQYSQYVGNKFVLTMHDVDALNSNPYRAVSTTTPVVGQWYHIAGVRDKAAGTMKIYVNGKLEGTTAYAGGWVSNGSFNVARGKPNADAVAGAIDEVNAYNAGLSDAEIADLYQASSASGRWRFNEDGGDIVDDASNDNRPLTLNNTDWVQGVSGAAAQFNGYNASASTDQAVLNTAGSFAVSAWVKLDNLNGWQTFVNQDGNNVSGFWLQYSQYVGNKFLLTMHDVDSTNSTAFRAVSTTTPVVGQWYHIVGVRDKAAGTMKIYVNGKLEGTTAYAGGWAANGNLNVGRGKWGGAGDWVAGTIDEVGAYGYSLTDAEVARLYNQTSLAAAWKFNEGVNNVTADVSGNNQPLTFVNSAWTPGVSGLGVQFNGVNAFGSTPSSVVDTAGNFAVSAWVKLDNLNGWQTFVNQDGNAVSGFYLQYSQYLGNKFALTMQDADAQNSNPFRAVSTTTPVVGQWYHLVGVRDKAAGTMKIYVNGKLEGTTAYAGGWASNGSLNVGRGKWGGAVDWVAGAIDEVGAYAYPLSDAEIAKLYITSGSTGAWKMNEGVTNVTADISAYNKPLTFNSAAWTGGASGLGVQLFGVNPSSGFTAGPVVDTAGNFTVSAWVKMDNLNGWQTFVNQDGNAISGFWLQYAQSFGNKFAFAMHNADAFQGGLSRAISTTTPVVGQWYHLVGVRDKAAGTIKLYVNGKLESAVPYTSAWASYGNFNLGRGKWGWGVPEDWFAGAIDEVGTFGYSMSDAQVANLYQAGL